MKLVWIDIRQTHKHLPQPRSVHPFYTDRKTSSLYKQNDLYSWYVWLWGNGFFFPGRRTQIQQFSDAELLQLYTAGFWSNSMEGKRKLNGDQIRAARGVELSYRERNEIARECLGYGGWCEEAYRNRWP